jgi:heme/copper-type cytochrome/quinol oxidase subunit 2
MKGRPSVLTFPRVRSAHLRLTFGVLIAALAIGVAATRAQSKKDFVVVAHKYGFTVDGRGSEIHVQQNDLVRITFSTEDIPHSFTVEDETYRIMRRAEPGKPVTFEFRADKAGRFPFKCTLTVDDRCKEMQGLLLVDSQH